MNKRLEYFDTAKGILILLVVFGHAWRAVYNNGILSNEVWYQRIDGWIYSFHMPAFFFLAGIFAFKSAGCPPGQFVIKKIQTIAYPYFVWSAIQTGLQILMTGSTTHTLTIKDFLLIPVVPVMQFWFLYTLFLIFMVFLALKTFTESPLFVWLVGLLVFVIFQLGYLPDLPMFVFVSQNFIYFATGVLCSEYLLALEKRQMATVSLMIAMIVSGLFSVLDAFFLHDCIITESLVVWLKPLFALPGVIMVAIAALLLSMYCRSLNTVFSLLGRRSLEIFVAHVIFLAGLRIGLLKIFHTNDLLAHLSGATIVGIAGPLVLVYVTERLQLRYIFTWSSTS